MFVHKDIIIVFIFILLVCLLFIFLFLKDLRSVIKNLQNFSGKPIKSSRLFFFKLYEPIIFNLNSILKKYQDNYRIEQLRVFFFNYFFKFFLIRKFEVFVAIIIDNFKLFRFKFISVRSH